MSKTQPQTLVEESKEGLSAFLKSGSINKKPLESKLDFSGLEIDDFDRLKRVHYVLSEEVVDFVQDLPEQIRRVKTESRREKETTRGEIKGRIDWNQTLKRRYSQNYKDKSLFVTKNPYIDYNIPENLVLKKVLGIIFEVINKELREVEYEWRKEKWGDELVEELDRIFRKNVHVNRIKDHSDIELSNRELEAARTSRKKIYRDAHKLFRQYQKLMDNNFDEEEVEKLLSETLVQPKNDDTLFEIFVLIKIVQSFRNKFELKPIRGGDEFARLQKKGMDVKIYYDSQGDLEFREGFDRNQGDSRYMRKAEEINEEFSLARSYFLGEEGNYTLYEGTPDIVIEFWRDEELVKTVVGEIKYTDKEATFSSGLEQLLEYIKFGRLGNTYIQEDFEFEGLVVTDKLQRAEPWDEKFKVSALNTEELLEINSEEPSWTTLNP